MLLMGDTGRDGVYKLPLNGSEEVKLLDEIYCPDSLALDFKTRSLYVADGCSYQLSASNMDGSDYRSILIDERTVTFPKGSSVYHNDIFWTKRGKTSSVECFNKETVRHIGIYSTNELLSDLIIVHSSNQPSGKFAIHILLV